MFEFEVINELMLRATCIDGGGCVYTKAGAMIAHQGNNKFDKVLLGPEGNAVKALFGQVARRLTGENLPLMKCTSGKGSRQYYADSARHVVVITLAQGQRLMVESENLLAFTDSCEYKSKFFGKGIAAQKGLFTTVLRGRENNAQVAVLSDGNPLILDSPCCVDPDALVAWDGADPQFKLDVSFKNLLGRMGASGESYQMEWSQPGTQVIIQPSERKSGIKLAID